MSYKPEVFVDGKWYPNALVFETRQEAALYAHDLYRRWSSAMDGRAVESTEPVTYRYVNGHLEALDMGTAR